MTETTPDAPARAGASLSLVTPSPWRAPDAIELACKAAVTDAFCALPEVDERKAVAAFLARVAADMPERWLGDPVVRRVIAFTFGTEALEPVRYRHVRTYVQLGRETRYLIGLAGALASEEAVVTGTQLLLRELQILWSAHDQQLAGDARLLEVVRAEIVREATPTSATTPEGVRTVQRLRTAFGVLACVALDRTDGARREEYAWDVADDVDLDACRAAIDQATVRQMQLASRHRRIHDLYFAVAEPVVRVRTIRWRGAVVEERVLNALPNYEAMIATGSAAGRS